MDRTAEMRSRRDVRMGDRIFVRLVKMEFGRQVIAEMTLDRVNDLSEVYGELRHHTRGQRGLTRLYVRNITRGWSFEQPFMLYAETRRTPAGASGRPAASLGHPIAQPEQRSAAARNSSPRREIPESIRLRYSM